MIKVKLKKDGNSYKAVLEEEIGIGKIEIKSKDKMVIHTHANIETMQQVYKEKLEQMAGLLNYNKQKEREDFDEALEEYARYKILELLEIKETPLRIVTDDDDNVVDIEGFYDETEFEIIEEE